EAPATRRGARHRCRGGRTGCGPYWGRGRGSFSRRVVEAALDTGQSLEGLIRVGDTDPGLLDLFLRVVDERRVEQAQRAAAITAPPAPEQRKRQPTPKTSTAAERFAFFGITPRRG